jgi:hypothetical protein
MTTFNVGTLSASQQRLDTSSAKAADPRWKGLYRAGGFAALFSVALILAAIIVHIAWPPPAWSAGAAIHWFTRFQDNWLLGLLGLDLLIVIGLVLGVPIFLALYVALRHAGESAMAIATTIALIGTVLHLTSNTALEMLSLSRAYAAATTEAQRAMFLAAGEATLAAYYGTAFQVSYVLGYAAKIVIGAVMLRSVVFSKATAYVGMLTGIVGLSFYVPTIGIFLSIFSVLLLAIWNFLVGRRLLQLGRSISKEERL